MFEGADSECVGSKMKRIRYVIIFLVILGDVPSFAGQEVLSLPGADLLFREAILRLRNVQLTPDQLHQIQELAAKYAPQIRLAEREAAESEAQQRARNNAIAKAVENGLRGARARELLTNATTRTDRQRAAFQRATRIRQEFDQAVSGLLTQSQRLEMQRPGKSVNATSGFIIIQLAPRLPSPPRSAKTLDQAATAMDLPALKGVIAQFGLTRSEPAVKAELLDRLEDARDESSSNEIKRLRAFWQIDIRMNRSLDTEQVLRSLNALPEVEFAYLATELDEPAWYPSVDPTNDAYYCYQGYLRPAPAGIDAPASWSLPGGQGAGFGLVDLERGWNIDHEDLKWRLEEPLYGQRLPGNDHGTSVLGEIVAEDNAVGIVGAAPRVNYVGLTSRYNSSLGSSEPHIANALAAALFFMDAGDVLLIEHETTTGYPTEIDPINYAAIRLAVASRMIVIEPAGNGDHDLDAFCWRGMPILNRHGGWFRDSGAIMVAASDPADGHNKANASCYGSRIDCFGWGNLVTTASSSIVPDILDNGGGDDNKSYRLRFNGTSSAAPMIAGAALLVQGLWNTTRGAALNSVAMREILSDPLTGTAQGSTVPGHIGVMPDLRSIIAARGLGAAQLMAPVRTVEAPQRRGCGWTSHTGAIQHARALGCRLFGVFSH